MDPIATIASESRAHRKATAEARPLLREADVSGANAVDSTNDLHLAAIDGFRNDARAGGHGFNVQGHVLHDRILVPVTRGAAGRAHGRSDALDKLLNVSGLTLPVPNVVEGGAHRAAVFVSEHDDELGFQGVYGEFDRAETLRIQEIPGDPNDEQIPRNLIEDDLDRNARVGAAEYDRERTLAVGELGDSRRERLGTRRARNKARVPCFERFDRIGRL